MERLPGVYVTTKKDGTVYYRASITIGRKHISLGSCDTMEQAGRIYSEAVNVYNSALKAEDYSPDSFSLSFSKFISLINYRDNKLYFKTPVYLYKKYFIYYIGRNDFIKFDADDLFFYSTHTIMRRKGHLFVADYGMQINILSRYGIREHAVCGRDYYFANKDNTDYRYGNIVIVNRYYGVAQYVHNGRIRYKVRIHINGDYVVGCYSSEEEAAVAYNKAAAILISNGCKKSFPENYPESLSSIAYASLYNSVKISSRIRNYRF